MTSNVKTGVGSLIISSGTGRVLFNLRSPDKTYGLCWSLWGGMVEGNETPKDALLREFSEEMGFVPVLQKIYPFDIYESKDKEFRFVSFVTIVDQEFIPQINHEAVGYCWVNLGVWPKPMHSGARKSFCSKKSEDKLKIILDQHMYERH